MTELNTYSINENLNTAVIRAKLAPASKDIVEDCGQLPVVGHCHRIDSKTILQNMEEVLDTVKKQHKEKHRRKKELKKLALIDASNGSEIVPPRNGDSKDKRKEYSEKKHKHRDKERRHSKNNPLQEKSTVENGKVLQISPVKSGSILQHFQRTPKKEEHAVIQQDEEVTAVVEREIVKEVETPPLNSKVTNAFEVMMNARNKSIGSNTPGKDCPSPVIDKELAAANARRKLKLQDWAEQKGGAKRKLEEEARAEYVEEQLEQRAKRFKKMLVSGASPKIASTTVAKTDRKTKIDKNKLKENVSKNKQQKRRGRKAQRLSSVDSVESVEQVNTTAVDSETSEFVAKLNSPTKKRDSLLGYFPKKESPKELAGKQAKKHNKDTKIERHKRSDKGISSNHSTTAPDNHPLLENKQEEIGASSGRPRRSCAGKARYDYDLEGSPSKAVKLEQNTPQLKNVTRGVKTQILKVPQEPDNVDIIILDDSTNVIETTTPQGTPKKLAPLFVRSLPKPSPDPEILKARRAFLQSGVPEKLRIEQERQKQYEQNFEETTEIFPKISHVKQISDNELDYNKEIHRYSFKLNSEESLLLSPSLSRKYKGRFNKRQSTAGSLSDCMTHDFQPQKNRCQEFSIDQYSLPTIENKRVIIKNWKTEFERFPTYKCYNQMREKYRYFSAIDSAQDTEQVTESFVVTRQNCRSLEAQKKKEPENPDEEYKPPATAPNGELLFSEKYKPLLFEQVLVNLNPVTQLKEFLSNWSNSGAGSGRNSQTLDDSMNLNDSSCSNQGPSSNTVVLLGPVSSGKTNAVFALANEMNFNVLEINAGMKRTGKRLIQELQEATQSHQIRKDSAGSGSSQKSLLKMSLNGLKSKLKRRNSNSNPLDSQNGDSNSADLQHSSRKCLILIEDADVVFEQTDAGFTDAIYTLAASSKRPVIVVASNPNCAHLQRLIAQNTIYFSSPNVLNISRFLAVLSLIENCPVQLDDLISLYLYNRRDLRKTLLELQFFIQTGGDRQRQLLDKKSSNANENRNPNYFASPRKRQFSIEQQESETSANNINTDKSTTTTTTTATTKSSDTIYLHRSLFEYYTVNQNSKWRIPFPIDFHLLNVNLNEIFQVSRNLKEDVSLKAGATSSKLSTKRKSKSPKKQWLTTARANSKTSLDNLCSFYENLSIAALMDKQDCVIHHKNKQKLLIIDRLKPNISETISHCLLEKTIEVNLDADLCPYNLFDTPKKSVSLSEEFVPTQFHSNRDRYLDYEPSLRSICRSEKIRSTLERRSTRFYHYLRNYSTNVCNFSTTLFDQACEAFQISDAEHNQTTIPA